MRIKITTTIFAVFALVMVMTPIFASAVQFVPCGGPGQHECGYSDLFQMINNIITWVIITAVPVSAGLFAYAGFLLMTSGVVDNKTKAKNIFKNVAIGFAFILSAWLIVTTVTNLLLNDDFKGTVPIEGAK